MGLNLWGSLTSKLDGYPIDLNPSPAGPSPSMKKIASVIKLKATGFVGCAGSSSI
jgi:hypothetical protein